MQCELQSIRRATPARSLLPIIVSLNLVEVGDTVVTGTESAVVADALRALGKQVIVMPLDEFHRAGGSAACLLAPILDLDLDAQVTVATSATAAMRSTAA